MNKNLCLAVLVFTHVCVFIQPAVGLPLRPEEDTDEPLPAAAMDFMQNIYQSKSAELRSDAKAATPNVWCFLPTTEEINGLQAEAGIQPEQSGKCAELAKYTFSTKMYIEEHEEKEMSTISKVLLRVYVQMQPKMDGNPRRANITVTTRMSSSAENISIIASVKKIIVTSESSNWKELPLTEELQQLYPLMTSDTRVTFELKVETGCSDEEQDQTVQLTGLADHAHLPHLVIFVDHEESKLERTESEERTPEENTREEEATVNYIFGNQDFKRSTSDQVCERQRFAAVFQELGLHMILAPYSVDIGICSGSCSDLSSSAFRASVVTNYGRLLSSIGSGEGDMPQKQPCCIPSKFSGLYLLIRYPDSSIALKLFSDAIVDKCKCSI